MKAKTYINYNNCSRRATSGEKKLLVSIFTLVTIVLWIVDIVTIGIFFKQKMTYTAETNATIINMERRYTTDSHHHSTIMYHPVYSFTYKNKEYTVTDNYGTSSPKHSINDVVKIKLNPDNPNKAYEVNTRNTFMGLFIGIFSFIGTIFTIVTFALRHTSPKKITIYNRCFYDDYLWLLFIIHNWF